MIHDGLMSIMKIEWRYTWGLNRHHKIITYENNPLLMFDVNQFAKH